MEKKFTPGPWCVSDETREKNEHGVFGIDINSLGIAVAHLATIWANTEEKVGSDPEAEANAKLIAAAPEMLESLEKLTKWAGSLTDWAGGTTIDPPIEEAMFVIKKATE